jgi:signal peptidase II
VVVAAGAIVVIFLFYRSLDPAQRLPALALSLILGGALGNLCDRIRLGQVVDFIDLHWREF